jgi:hypothetical protein
MTLRSAPISNPTNTAHSGRGPLAVLRRAKNIKNASEPDRAALRDNAERLENWAARLVLAAIVLEAVVWASPLNPCLFKFGNFLADAAVAIGIYGEMRFGHVVADVLKISLAESIDARAELETKLWPRMLDQEQWDFVQGLKGKFPMIAIAFETDSETRWFASQIRDAFFSAGIAVAMYERAAEVHSFGTFIFEPKGFDGARAKTVEPLVELFGMMELTGTLAIITEVPTDILLAMGSTRPEMCAPLDTPMIIIGGRFVLPPPHLERLAKAAKNARDKMKGKA